MSPRYLRIVVAGEILLQFEWQRILDNAVTDLSATDDVIIFAYLEIVEIRSLE
jgi:hypothetical protein